MSEAFRAPRFGLRTLFVFALLLCLGSAWIGRNVHRTWQEDAAIETLRRAGAALVLHGHPPYSSVQEEDERLDRLIDRAAGAAFFDRMLGRSYRPKIQGVVIDDRTAPESTILAAVDAMPLLSEIEGVTLWGSDFDDATCDALSRLPNLESLGLRGTNVGDLGLSRLESLPHLRTLTLSDPSDTKALAALPRLKRLRELTLFNRYVSHDEIAGIATLPELQSLELLFVQSSDERAFVPLGGADDLRSLSIVSPSFRDEDLAALAGLRELERLDIHLQEDASLVHLAGLSKLRRLALVGAATPEAVRRFSAERPELLIELRESLAKTPRYFQKGVSLDLDLVNQLQGDAANAR